MCPQVPESAALSIISLSTFSFGQAQDDDAISLIVSRWGNFQNNSVRILGKLHVQVVEQRMRC
jgi:hypothetical protein